MSSSSAERVRRFRERKKAAGDDVRLFLNAVVGFANDHVEAEDAAPWMLARADAAVTLLAGLDGSDTEAAGPVLPGPLGIVFGLLSENDQKYVRWLAENAYQRQQRPVTGRKGPVVQSAAVQQALASLRWVQGEQKTGWTSPVLAQGLRSAALIIRERSKARNSADLQEWLAAEGAKANLQWLEGLGKACDLCPTYDDLKAGVTPHPEHSAERDHVYDLDPEEWFGVES